MNKQVAIIIDWYGPYDLESAKSAAKEDYGPGLYMLIGKVKSQKSPSKLQYIGIADKLDKRLGNNNIAISKLTQELEIWMGEVASFGVPGRKRKATDPMLDFAELAHIYFLDPPLNTKGRENPPSESVVVYNRWWKRDYETLRVKRPHPDWPELIDFIGEDYGAKVAWLNGTVKKWASKDF